MIPLDSVLPEIQRAVNERVESSTLASMDPDELRQLIYKLVERQRVTSLNASDHFKELVAAANQHHSDLVEAKENSVSVRVQLLKELLAVLRPAFPSLMGPIVISTAHYSARERSDYHPLLRGCELLNGVKSASQGPNVVTRSGSSWWIVGLPGENPTAALDPRYARLRHRGELRAGDGTVSSDLELVTSEEAACFIRDHQFEEILKTAHERLVNVAGKRVVKTTDSLWEVADALNLALDAMRTHGVAKAQ